MTCWSVLFPTESVHRTVIVYTRPLPFPARSALRLAVRSPVISQSGAVSPSPSPFSGSLLAIEMIWQVAYADGRLDSHEDYLVHKLATLLRLDHKQLIEAKLKILHGDFGGKSD